MFKSKLSVQKDSGPVGGKVTFHQAGKNQIIRIKRIKELKTQNFRGFIASAGP